MNRSRILMLSALAVAILPACAGNENRQQARAPQTQSYAALQAQELERERAEFIRETREELAEVDNEVARLEVRLEYESRFVEQDQRDAWSRELSELQQEQASLKAQLERARTASPEEWQAMRGGFGTTIDSIQARLAKIGQDVRQAFDSRQQPAMLRADSGLCPVDVPGADASVSEEKGRVVVELTTSNDRDVPELRERARTLAKAKSYQPGSTEKSQATVGRTESATEANEAVKGMKEGPEAIPVERVSIQNVTRGVKISFATANAESERLRERLESDADALERGACAGRSPAATSMR